MTNTDVETPGTPAAPPPAPPARPPLSRPRETRVVGGVAAGVARHFGWDPVLVRIGFVILAFMGGAGIIAYLAGWILLPEDGSPDVVHSPADLAQRGAAFWIGAGLLGLAAILLIGWTPLRGGLVLAVALGAIGVALWKTGDQAGRPSSPTRAGSTGLPSSVTTQPRAPGPESEPRVETAGIETLPPPMSSSGWGGPGTPLPQAAPARPRRERPRSYLGRLTLALALLAAAVAMVLDRTDALPLTGTQQLGVVLTVVAAGLVVGAWVGRARWLIVIALLMTFALGATLVADEFALDLGSGMGERYVTIHGASDEGVHRLGIGRLTLDLGTALDDEPGGRTLELEASVGLGELEIRLPADPDVGYRITASVRNGEIRESGDVVRGRRIERTFVREARGSAGTIVVEASVGAGQIEIIG